MQDSIKLYIEAKIKYKLLVALYMYSRLCNVANGLLYTLAQGLIHQNSMLAQLLYSFYSAC